MSTNSRLGEWVEDVAVCGAVQLGGQEQAGLVLRLGVRVA